MPVNTNVANAKAILEALADFLDKPMTPEVAVKIVEQFIGDIGGATPNEDKAAAFMTRLIAEIRSAGPEHVREAAKAEMATFVEDQVTAAESNL